MSTAAGGPARRTALPTELLAQVRRLDEHQLRRLAIVVRGLLETAEGPHLEPSDVDGRPAVRYRQKHVRCGKRCSACPHGPYWYASWKEGGRSRTAYIGRELPPDVRRLLEQMAAADAGVTGQGSAALPDEQGQSGLGRVGNR